MEKFFVFGNNTYGQLGLDDISNVTVPTLLMKDDTIKRIYSGGNHSMLFKNEGDLFVFGCNQSGQLGLGNNVDQRSPVLLLKDDKLQEISCGGAHSLLMKKNGEIWGFGRNDDGQLGLGNKENQHKPVLMMKDKSISEIIAGGFHTMILKKNGELWVCGNNSHGQLGLNNCKTKSTPFLLMTDDKISMVSCGVEHSLILLKTGVVLSFGRNDDGQLDLGNNLDQSLPATMLVEHSIKAISCGGWHSFFLKHNGDLYAFGKNKNGQLGLGNKQNMITPQIVMQDTSVRELMGISTKVGSDVFFPMLNHLMNASKEPEKFHMTSIPCGNGNLLNVYSSLLAIRCPMFSQEITESEQKIFKFLSTAKLCFETSSYIHCGCIDLQSLSLIELFNLLQFSIEVKTLNNLKASIGLEIEVRSSLLDAEQLGIAIKYLHENQFFAGRDWLLYHFNAATITETQLNALDFPKEILFRLVLAKQDNHLNIFSDILNNSKNSISISRARDASGLMKDFITKLWETRDTTGDYLVTSQQDGQQTRYHKLILTYIPFFKSQSESIFVKGSDQHHTNLKSSTFEAFMKYVYTGDSNHFNFTNSYELLDPVDGLKFYFAISESSSELFERLSRILTNEIEYLKKKDCLETLLFAIRYKIDDLQDLCMQVFYENEELIDEISAKFDQSTQLEILKFIARHKFKSQN